VEVAVVECAAATLIHSALRPGLYGGVNDHHQRAVGGEEFTGLLVDLSGRQFSWLARLLLLLTRPDARRRPSRTGAGKSGFGLIIGHSLVLRLEADRKEAVLPHHHHLASYLLLLTFHKNLQLVFGRRLGRDPLINLPGERAVGARRPGQNLEDERLFVGRDDVPRSALVEPARVAELPRFQMGVIKPPRGHLINRPFGGVFVIWRAG